MSRILCANCLNSFEKTDVKLLNAKPLCKSCYAQAQEYSGGLSQGQSAAGTRPKDAKKPSEQRNFFQELPGAFSFPFQGSGLIMLVLGTLFFWALQVLASLSIFGILVAIFAAGYISAFMIEIISSSAIGNSELPDWPDFSNFWDSIISPFFLIIATQAVAFAPALIYIFIFLLKGLNLFLLGLLLLLGLLYLPMGLLAVALCNTVAALNPRFIISSILRVRREYLMACVVFFLLFVINLMIKFFIIPIPIISSLLTGFVNLYLLMVEMRILGLIYFSNSARLGWFPNVK